MSGLAGITQADDAFLAPLVIDKTQNTSDSSRTRSEGLLLESPPTFIEFDGSNGLQLKISLPRSRMFDYTLMFWVRSKYDYAYLKTDQEINGKKKYLFEIVGGCSCWITRLEGSYGPRLACNGGDDFFIDLEGIPDIQAWMHLTYSANYRAVSASNKSVFSSSYVQLDISSSFTAISEKNYYLPITNAYVYYGSGDEDPDTPGRYKSGFMGDYRQFWITVGFIHPSNVRKVMHQYKVLDYSTMGYYKFEQTILLGRYDDSFRIQKAKQLTIFPQFHIENIAAPFCNSIPQKYVQVP